MNTWEFFYCLFVHPLFALRQKHKPLGLSLFILFLVVMSLVVSSAILKDFHYTPVTFSFTLIFLFLLTLIFFLLLSCIYHFISEGLKGKGNPWGTFSSLLLSTYPGIFLIPLALLFQPLHQTGVLNFFLFQFLIVIWIVGLQIYSLKFIYGIDSGTAVLVYFFPLIASVAFLFLLFILLFLFLFSLIGETLPSLPLLVGGKI